MLGIEPASIRSDPEFVALGAGNLLPEGTEPLAAIYAGHQFGSYVPQLGDGRAITLGEVEGFEWQLKGSGLTAFSRFADGRAVLRSTIREFLCSEALDALAIPTTRALSVVGSDEPVFREHRETAAVLTRLAPSHVRFGSFEVFHYRRWPELVRALADYVIENFYPELRDSPAPYLALLREVVARTARLVARWQAVGFAHGVMNTDNMSILGLTLDYGPYGFIDAYDPGFVCNHSDETGRYAFDRQPTIALWNCYALAEALGELVELAPAREALGTFEPLFRQAFLEELRAKLGLETAQDDDAILLGDLLQAMELDRADYTNTWRALATVTLEPGESAEAFASNFTDRERIDAWLGRYRARLVREGSVDAARRPRMDRVNPKYVLRNYLAQTAIEAAQRKDFGEIARLLHVLRNPYDEWPQYAAYSQPPPEWARHISVSCSS